MRDVLSLSSPQFIEEKSVGQDGQPIGAEGSLVVIDIAAIEIPARLRIVDHDQVRALAASRSEVGELQPIAVSPKGDGSNGYVLVDGEHRIEANKLLGRTTITAIVRDQTPAEREKAEIHANLIRNELNAIERTLHIGRLANIHAIENPDDKNGGDRKSLKWKRRNQFANIANWSAFDKAAARRTDLSVRSIQLGRELANKLSPDAIAAIRTCKLADSQSQIKTLAGLPPDQQVTVARLIAAGGAPNVRRASEIAGFAKPAAPIDPAEVLIDRVREALPRMTRPQVECLSEMVARRSLEFAPKGAKAPRANAVPAGGGEVA